MTSNGENEISDTVATALIVLTIIGTVAFTLFIFSDQYPLAKPLSYFVFLFFIIMIIVFIISTIADSKTKKLSSLMMKYDAPAPEIAKQLSKTNFVSYGEYKEAKELGFNDAKDFRNFNKYGSIDFEEIRLIINGNFSDHTEFIKAKDLDAQNKEELKSVLKYNSPSFRFVKKIEEGSFPDYASFKGAIDLRINNYDHYLIHQKYGTPEFFQGKKLFIKEKESLILRLSDDFIKFTLNKFIELFLSDDFSRLFYPNINNIDLVKQFLSETNLKLSSDDSQQFIILHQATNQELERLKEFIRQIGENIPVTIDRIAEKTDIRKGRLEIVFPLIIHKKDFFGIYRK
ncbi:MAG: hypothetical protein HeimC3_43540 [Candidatus Heimdallarchaeota archaeon LC_3]|nr:MAG: hypothetical protein HeimC3_43540 [Candidatus Heimdallarchaeota archaeon LC_3]